MFSMIKSQIFKLVEDLIHQRVVVVIKFADCKKRTQTQTQTHAYVCIHASSVAVTVTVQWQGEKMYSD